eukprot:CAMPEP_0119571142 /NCGR_PEP_ID=MMETSP1352-20130426/43969_1 /TAXON_ID=265584 /ORGANISM="Stauroneis constricta, Strain CCMP1120" /LENGTH=587 /DNA_ID=CAMNT_0007620821 /DNA_START=31 /DNA_END=1794 /DNA_ORIENTATION=+
MEAPKGEPFVKITIHGARDLVAKDKNMFGKKTTSDPYVKILAGKTKLAKTQVKPKNLSPTWDETFRFPWNDIQKGSVETPTGDRNSLTLAIYDHDKVGADDCMGCVKIPIIASSSSLWYTVEKGSLKPHFCKNATGELLVSVIAQHPVELQAGNAIPVQSSKLDVGLAWDLENPDKPIDLDAACVALDRSGNILMENTVYFGHISNEDSSIVHSGDELTGETQGDDERISLQLDRIPSNVLALYFILSVATPGMSLKHVKSAQVNIYRGDATAAAMPFCQFAPSNMGSSTTMFLARLARDTATSDDWMLRPIEVGIASVRNFGATIPHLKGFTRDLLPNIVIDPGERIAVMRQKGVIQLKDYGTESFRIEMSGAGASETARLRNLSLGLAWDITNGTDIDLDASILCLDSGLSMVDKVYFSHKMSMDGAIRHSGDEVTGTSGGDDETITLQLDKVSSEIMYLGITINSYSGQELDDVAQASCHLYDTASKRDIATYALTNASELDNHTALLVACLYRTTPGSNDWMLRTISEPANGTLATDLLDELQAYLRNNPAEDPEYVVNPNIDRSYIMPAPKPFANGIDVVLY